MIRICPSAFILLAMLILMLPLDWLVAALLAAAAHELGHLAVIFAVGKHPESVLIGGMGAKIRTAPLDNREEFLCAASGPMVSLSLLFLFRFLPKMAFCGLVQGIFNLIPVYAMDGGRMLLCTLRRFCPRQAERVFTIIQYFLLWGFLAFSLIITILAKNGILPVLACLLVLSRLLLTKIPCKSA